MVMALYWQSVLRVEIMLVILEMDMSGFTGLLKMNGNNGAKLFKVMMVITPEVLLSVLKKRVVTSGSFSRNYSINLAFGDIPKNHVVTNLKSVICIFISYGYISASF